MKTTHEGLKYIPDDIYCRPDSLLRILIIGYAVGDLGCYTSVIYGDLKIIGVSISLTARKKIIST